MEWIQLPNGTWRDKEGKQSQILTNEEYKKNILKQTSSDIPTIPTSTRPVYPGVEGTKPTTPTTTSINDLYNDALSKIQPIVTTTTPSTTGTGSFKTKEDIAATAQNAYNQAQQSLQGLTTGTALLPRTTTDYPLPVTIAQPQIYDDVREKSLAEYQKSLAASDYTKAIGQLQQQGTTNLDNYLNAYPSFQMNQMTDLSKQMANVGTDQQFNIAEKLKSMAQMTPEEKTLYYETLMSGQGNAGQANTLNKLQNLDVNQLNAIINQMQSGNQGQTNDVYNQTLGAKTTSQQQQALQQLQGLDINQINQVINQMQGLNTNQTGNVYNQTLGAAGANSLQQLLQGNIASSLNQDADALASALYQKTANPLQQEFERLRQSTQSSMAGRGLGNSTIVEGALEDPTRSYLSQLQQASLGAQIQGQQFAQSAKEAATNAGLNLSGQLSSQQLQALQQAGVLAGQSEQQNLANLQATGNLTTQAAQQQLAQQQAVANQSNILGSQQLQALQQAGALAGQSEQERLAQLQAAGNLSGQTAQQNLANIQAAGTQSNTLAAQQLQAQQQAAQQYNNTKQLQQSALTSAGSLANQTAAQKLASLQQAGSLSSTIEQINQQKPIVAQQLINQMSQLPGLQQIYSQGQLQNALNAQQQSQNVQLYNTQAQQEEWYKRIEQMNNQMKMAIASLNQVSLPMTQLTTGTNSANLANVIAQQQAQNQLFGNLIGLAGTTNTNPYNTVG